MLLILSGSYISAEMQSEFGRIPPVFLPLAGQPLLKYQIEALQERAIFVALPSTYELSCAESRLIEDYGVEVIRVSEGLSLRECFVDCLSYFDEYKDSITDKFDWLFVDFNTLRTKTSELGFKTELVLEGDSDDYLVKLTLSS